MKCRSLLGLVAFSLLGASPAWSAIIYKDYSSSPLESTAWASQSYPVITREITLDLPSVSLAGFYRQTASDRQYFQLANVNLNRDLSNWLNALDFGKTWSDLPSGGVAEVWGDISTMDRTSFAISVPRTNPTFIPFTFADSILKYGYVKLSTEVTGTGAGSGLLLKVYGYGYDDSGAQIAMGVGDVPVPATLMLLIPGLGALLAWRKRAGRSRVAAASDDALVKSAAV